MSGVLFQEQGFPNQMGEDRIDPKGIVCDVNGIYRHLPQPPFAHQRKDQISTQVLHKRYEFLVPRVG